jgi:hypothetical protein
MRNKKILAALLLNCCFLTCASVAPAAIIGTATLVKAPRVGVPFASGGAGTLDATLGAPWVSFRLSLTATGGDTIQAVDVNIQGILHQRWSSSNSDSVYDTPTPNSSNATNADSHLLAAASAIIGAPPTEDNPFSGSSLSASNGDDFGYGVGHSLTGAWAVNGAAVTSLNLAYIVVPEYVFPSIQVRIATPTGDILTIPTYDYLLDAPSIAVLGGGNFIPIGDTSPTSGDNTDFGVVTRGSLQERTFTITTFGDNSIFLQTPTITGPFSLVGSFPTFLPAHGSATFTLALNDASSGHFNGTISFPTSVSFASHYSFSLAATVVPEPASRLLAAMAAVGAVSYRRRRATRRRHG